MLIPFLISEWRRPVSNDEKRCLLQRYGKNEVKLINFIVDEGSGACDRKKAQHKPTFTHAQ